MEARSKMSSSWGHGACLGSVFCFSMVGFLTFGIDLFSQMNELHGYTLAQCNIEQVAMLQPSPRLCCHSRLSASCSWVHNPNDTKSIASHIGIVPNVEGTLGASTTCTPASFNVVCGDNNHMCCQGGMPSTPRCYDANTNSRAHCRTCYIVMLKVQIHQVTTSVSLSSTTQTPTPPPPTTTTTPPSTTKTELVEISFPSTTKAKRYLDTHHDNTKVTCYYNDNTGTGAQKVVIHEHVLSPKKIALLSVFALGLVISPFLLLLISIFSRAHIALPLPSSSDPMKMSKVYPQDI